MLSCLIPLAFLAATVSAQEPRLTFHAAPSPLAKDAVTVDWPRMLGPMDNATSPETRLLKTWPPEGPKMVWEISKGDGYTAPSIVGTDCVLFHAIEKQETVECVNAETGAAKWSMSYPIEYQDRLGYANGPRGSATVSQGQVVTLGVTSMLHCLDLASGKVLWKKDLRADYKVPQEFFGHGSTPLVWQDLVIINVGGKAEAIGEFEDKDERNRKLASAGVCVAAFDLKTGAEKWRYLDEWGSSYASPIVAKFYGKERLLVFAGGESDPAIGGLLCLDPSDGKRLDRISWRADMYTSVNATTPVVIPDKSRVLITTAYPKGIPIGALMLQFDEAGKAKELWRSEKLACHWMQPIYVDGHLYAIDGETERQAELVCVDAETGKEVWRKEHQWTVSSGGRDYNLGLMRASLLQVDGATLCLGETGSLHWLELSPQGMKELARAQLWLAPHTWSLPVVSHGLLYVAQHEQGQDGKRPRFICYDLRAPSQE